jgi:hypothetical protein
MDAQTKHRDRYNNEPELNKYGQPIVAYMTARQQRFLRLLADRGTLTINDLHDLLGGGRRGVYDTARRLRDKGNEYIRVLPEVARARNLRQPLVFQLAPRGVEWLNANGRLTEQPRRVYNLGHTNLVSHIMASITAGIAQQPGARLIPWDEIQRHQKFPKETLTAKDNTAIPHEKGSIRPDTHPFGIEVQKDGKPKFIFLVVEADNGTETIYPTKPRDYKGNSIYAKFEAYLAFVRSKGFHERYGLPHYFVLFVFTNPQRLTNAMALLGSMGGSRNILFQLQKPDAAPGYIFTTPSERVGYEPLTLS